MKKKIILTVCLILSAIFAFSGCSSKPDYTKNISELKDGIYRGENENYSALAYSGYREKPYLADGKVGETAHILNLKLTPLFDYSEVKEWSVSVNINGVNYGAEPTEIAGKKYLMCNYELPAEPPEQFDVTVYCDGEASTLTLNCVSEDYITFDSAFATATDEAKDFINANSSEEDFVGEIHARIVSFDDRCFWYVGFIAQSGNKCAVLIDAKSGEVLAKKTDA